MNRFISYLAILARVSGNSATCDALNSLYNTVQSDGKTCCDGTLAFGDVTCTSSSNYMTGQKTLNKDNYKGAFYECINGVIWGFTESGDHLSIGFIKNAGTYGPNKTWAPAPVMKMVYDPKKRNGLASAAPITFDPPQQLYGIMPASDAFYVDADFSDDYTLLHPKLFFKHVENAAESVYGIPNTADFYQRLTAAFGPNGWRQALMDIDYRVTFGAFVPDAIVLGQELHLGEPYTCKRITRSGNTVTVGTAHNRYATGTSEVQIYHPDACKEFPNDVNVNSTAFDPCLLYQSYAL